MIDLNKVLELANAIAYEMGVTGDVIFEIRLELDGSGEFTVAVDGDDKEYAPFLIKLWENVDEIIPNLELELNRQQSRKLAADSE